MGWKRVGSWPAPSSSEQTEKQFSSPACNFKYGKTKAQGG